MITSDGARAANAPAAGAIGLRRALFEFVEPADAAALDAALPAPSGKIHYVRIDAALIAGKQSPFWGKPGESRVRVPLPDGGSLAVTVDGSEMLGADRFVSRGRIEGRPASRAIFAYSGGFLHASIEDPVLGSFALRAATDELSQFYRVDPALVPPCGGGRRPLIDHQVLTALAQERARAAGATGGATTVAPGPAAAADNPQRADVHLMMLYTPAILPGISATLRNDALQSAFDAEVAKVNAALAASQISARVRLVRIAQTVYDESVSTADKVQDDALTALYRADDGKMDEIHGLRDAAGADVVCLAMGRADSRSSGLSFLLDDPTERANPLFAFAVVQYGHVAGTNVVAHEMGHVFGCAHDRENASSGAGAYPYSYGYRFYGADGRQYRDIMSYPPGTQLAYFSTPKIVLPAPISVPLGVASGSPGEADTARTIEENAFVVSSYRLQTLASPDVGTLVNVATRAHVGTGEQVLIGGFVIGGGESKQMLVRGAGPALSAFGVPEALRDPVLQIHGGAGLLAQNDNWSTQSAGLPAAGEVASRAQLAGAFPFAAGSGDAALLLTLPPGPYTAILQGAGGATGAGLIEAYEVNAAGGSIINLATRGYADNVHRPMVGGFVVSTAPGTTKRILIRVLGPTLERPPYHIASALFDPFMELRGADGRLLLQNDDWSSGASYVDNTRDDFQPVVRLYDEKQISATGFAPANRREPCVMVDLPPGSYTVIVKPFELRDPNPDLDQPARPGVGIVEVYEIRR